MSRETALAVLAELLHGQARTSTIDHELTLTTPTTQPARATRPPQAPLSPI